MFYLGFQERFLLIKYIPFCLDNKTMLSIINAKVMIKQLFKRVTFNFIIYTDLFRVIHKSDFFKKKRHTELH